MENTRPGGLQIVSQASDHVERIPIDSFGKYNRFTTLINQLKTSDLKFDPQTQNLVCSSNKWWHYVTDGDILDIVLTCADRWSLWLTIWIEPRDLQEERRLYDIPPPPCTGGADALPAVQVSHVTAESPVVNTDTIRNTATISQPASPPATHPAVSPAEVTDYEVNTRSYPTLDYFITNATLQDLFALSNDDNGYRVVVGIVPRPEDKDDGQGEPLLVTAMADVRGYVHFRVLERDWRNQVIHDAVEKRGVKFDELIDRDTTFVGRFLGATWQDIRTFVYSLREQPGILTGLPLRERSPSKDTGSGRSNGIHPVRARALRRWLRDRLDVCLLLDSLQYIGVRETRKRKSIQSQVEEDNLPARLSDQSAAMRGRSAYSRDSLVTARSRSASPDATNQCTYITPTVRRPRHRSPSNY